MSLHVYPWLYRHLIRLTDPEQAHHSAIIALSYAGSFAPTRGLMRSTCGYLRGGIPPLARRSPYRSVTIGERVLPGVLGLAAGMDKDAQAVEAMCALGFAFVEIGTVTPRPQPGNDGPRLWRLIDEGGLRNRMGFNNEGAAAAAARLKALRSTPAGRSLIVGANIGKNKVTSESDAPRDYYLCAKELAPWVDFVVVNVSSPNTPGLRDLQAVDHLRPILEAARAGCEDAVDRRMPLFIKIAPDLSNEDIVTIVELTQELGVEGIVATNTTITHDYGEGGVSGQPLFERALEVVGLIAEHLTEDQILIGTGGITTVEDAQQMLDAGADLIEGLSAFVSQGPTWPGRMNRSLAGY